MATSRIPCYLMQGTVYVMTIKDQDELRIGVYSTSKQSRETQVRSGIGLDVEIIWEEKLASKAHALAVETLAHLYLCEFEQWQKVGKKTVQVFHCSKVEAKDACEKAVKAISAGLMLAISR